MTQDVTSARRVVLEGPLTLRSVEAVRATLQAAFEQQTDIAIDCAAADEIDLSFIQVLIAARASAVRLGGTVGLVAPPGAALLDTMTRAGFRAVAESPIGDTEVFWIDGDPL